MNVVHMTKIEIYLIHPSVQQKDGDSHNKVCDLIFEDSLSLL